MDLPTELVIEIGLHLSLSSIYNLIRVNKRFMSIFDSDQFWRKLFDQDHTKHNSSQGVRNWKEEYRNSLGCIYILGHETWGLPKIINKQAEKVACGNSHMLILDSNGKVWALGNNMYGQLGIENEGRPIKEPIQILNLKAIDVACGSNHSLVITPDHSVWGFGLNTSGQLGFHGDWREERPVQIPGLKAKTFAAGDDYSIVVSLDETVWAFGENTEGQLGLRSRSDHFTPTQIPNLRAVAVAAGYYHTLALAPDNTVWVFGSNEKGQLGLGEITFGGYDIPVRLPNIKARAIAVGKYHSIIVDLDSSVWAFGSNEYGQLELRSSCHWFWTGESAPVRLSGIKAKKVSANSNHSMILDTEGAVWTFGRNKYGQLGVTSPEMKVRSISAGGTFNIIIAFRCSRNIKFFR